MAEQAGRLLLLKLGNGASPEVFTTVGGLTSSSISTANGTVDITTFDDAGIRTLLAGKFGVAYSISGSGLTQDTAQFASLRALTGAGTANNFQFVNPDTTGGIIYEGPFIATSFEETAELNAAAGFSISLESSGAVTLT